MPRWTYAAALVLLAGCGADDSTGAAASSEAVAGLDGIERVVTVGDNIGSNPSYTRSYIALLQQNDDELFEAFVGKDFATALPAAEWIRLDRGGDSYGALAKSGDAVRLCGAASSGPCVPPADGKRALVIVELGINDLVATALGMISDPSRRDDPDALVTAFQADVATVLEQVTSPDAFDPPPRILVTNVADPSDGVGDIAALVTQFFPIDGAEEVTPELALSLIARFNAAIATEAAAIGAELVDLHAAFLGHGYHSNEASAPNYRSEDPTRWYGTLVDPNLRGAHEIRRALWAAITGEVITAIPTDLPLDSIAGLPGVPDHGWANAVTAAEVTPSLTDDSGRPFTNIAKDPEKILGPPDGTALTGTVALGVVGAWIVVDLGEGEAATDGEGEDLVVLEFGAQSGGVPEPYRVSVSDQPDGPWTILADGRGERAFDLADTGLASARYVRIESLAQRSEVLGGVGSPFFPGGEFDAVGAVYPGP